ncbi:glycosyltransferase [Limnohabitans sp. G3-2]|uniref:glycosyltransferase n=1 Tax=Limnohabitans sp. G3-2 TaxID=1100711 RepID=UPI000C1F6001|nr:glycosyltransferase [Limnohabitans sp. G3-2]PIT73912.1 hypothetical protein B9Z31_08590 [Limnohabitans sp. G3-2]
MSVYRNDRPDHLALALQSIQGAGHVLIGVDGPVSESVDAILETASKSRFVDVIRYAENRGLAHVLNDLIDYSLSDPECEFVFRMDADDVSHAERFKLQVEFMRCRPDIGVSGVWAKIIDENGRTTSEICKSHDDRILKLRLAYDSPFVHPTVVFRATVLRQGWRYPTDTIRFEDVALWARMACAGVCFSNLEAYLIDYRQTLATDVRRSGLRKSWCEFRIRATYVINIMPWRMDSIALALAILISKILLPSRARNLLYAVRKRILSN